MVINCPFCKTKFFIEPQAIPDLGKEKRCINCYNKFRILKVGDEVIVQFKPPKRKIDEQKNFKVDYIFDVKPDLGDKKVQEIRYKIVKEGENSEKKDEFKSLFEMESEKKRKESKKSEEKKGYEEFNIKDGLRIEDVAGDLDSFRSAKSPKVISAKDILKPKSVKKTSKKGGGESFIKSLLAKLKPVDYALLSIFFILLIAAIFSLSGNDVLGLFSDKSDALKRQQLKKKSVQQFSKKEIYNIINLIPEKKDTSEKKLVFKDVNILPEKNYDKLFVEEISIKVTSVPDKAEIYLNNNLVGTTPAILKIEASSKEQILKVKKTGYYIKVKKFVAMKDYVFDFKLKKIPKVKKKKKKKEIETNFQIY